MEVRNCNRCFQLFEAQGPDDDENFCNLCACEYDVAFVCLHQYIINHEKPSGYQLQDKEFLMKTVGVERIFVERFFQDSTFAKGIFCVKETNCERCNVLLEPVERKFCRPCSRQVAIKIQNFYYDYMDMNSHKGKKQAKDENNRYGLGRDL